MYTVNVVPAPQQLLTLADLAQGELAIVTSGQFVGELFYKNVAGLHSISGDRYWPSSYASVVGVGREYRGPLEATCNRVSSGDTLVFTSERF